MERVTLDTLSGVSRLRLQSTYYVKAFKGQGSRLKFYLGISRYQRELRNLKYFATLGLATPQLIAYGHESHLGRLQRAVLVTAEVAGATDLETLVVTETLYQGGIKGARSLLQRLAHATRLLHDDGFYHKDLKTRNILVRDASPAASNSGHGALPDIAVTAPELFFFDCPSGHHPPRFMLKRCIVRDLAHLEDGLRGHLRRVDLLYLYKQYLGCEKLSSQDKTLARLVLTYYAQRRMTRKRRLRSKRKQANTQT